MVYGNISRIDHKRWNWLEKFGPAVEVSSLKAEPKHNELKYGLGNSDDRSSARILFRPDFDKSYESLEDLYGLEITKWKLKIDRETHELQSEQLLNDCLIEEFKEELPSQQPRFILLSWSKKHTDERVSYPMLLVYYCPNESSPELQMLYAGSRNFIVNECQVSKSSEVRDIDEIDEDLLDSKF